MDLHLLKRRKMRLNNLAALNRRPFDERHKTEPLSLVVTIINRHYASYFLNAYNECGAALSIVLYTYSKPPPSILDYMGSDETKKEIILTIARSEYVPAILKKAGAHFRVSKVAKGIAFALPITGVAGIAAYRYLADFNKPDRLMTKGAKAR